MALTITETEVTSDLVPMRAEFRANAAADGAGAWIVSGRPARLFTREQAITAVQLAEDELLADVGSADEDPDCE